MSIRPATKALIAEDEPLLAAGLRRELAALWLELEIRIASDGLQAVDLALQWLPDVLLFDVRMPGQSGLDAAQDIAERWPAELELPLLVFVTAFDEYAVQAFEHAAVDYLVKPVKAARLRQSVERIQALALAKYDQSATKSRASSVPTATVAAATDLEDATLHALRQLLLARPDAGSAPPRLQRIQASVGQQIVVVPLSEVLCFEAADKYVRVLTGVQGPERELLIRTPIKDLLAQLDPDEFWQIHRSTLVRASCIETVSRDEAGRLSLQLRGRKEKWAISRVYAPLFKAM
jgi:DNA-binding LytR/AlgR family response regulator